MTLQVRVTGVPTPTLTWYHNGQEVAADYSTELQGGRLVICSVEMKHSGGYQVVATNTAGRDERITKLTVSTDTKQVLYENIPLSLKPVAVDKFGEFVSLNHKMNDKGFKAQYSVSISCYWAS